MESDLSGQSWCDRKCTFPNFKYLLLLASSRNLLHVLFSGGVLPPGAAFAKTNIISELEDKENGLMFEIVDEGNQGS